MKNLNQLGVFAVIIFSIFLIISCDNTEYNTLSPDKSLEAMLSEIVELGEFEKKIISFDIVFDKSSNSFSYANVEIIKESKKIIDFVKGADPDFKYIEGSYEVECTDAEGEVTTTTCSNYACVGYAVASCVEGGGCAKVCKAEAKYYPSIIE